MRNLSFTFILSALLSSLAHADCQVELVSEQPLPSSSVVRASSHFGRGHNSPSEVRGHFEGFLQPEPGRFLIFPGLGLVVQVARENLVYVCLEVNGSDLNDVYMELQFLEVLPASKGFLNLFGKRPESVMRIKPLNLAFEPSTAKANLLNDFFGGFSVFRQIHQVIQDARSPLRTSINEAVDRFAGAGIDRAILKEGEIQLSKGVHVLGHVVEPVTFIIPLTGAVLEGTAVQEYFFDRFTLRQ